MYDKGHYHCNTRLCQSRCSVARISWKAGPMPFPEEHERLVAIETALGCLLFEVIKAGRDPTATRDSFSTGMREAAAAYPKSALNPNANPDSIARAFGISSAIEQLLNELIETVQIGTKS